MQIRLYCGKCGKKFRIDPQYAGQVGECSRCNARIPIPYSDLKSITIRLFCDFCHEGIKVSEEHAHTRIACPKCSARIDLPPLNLTDDEYRRVMNGEGDESSDAQEEAAETNHDDEGAMTAESGDKEPPKVEMRAGGVGRPEQYTGGEPSKGMDRYIGDQRRRKNARSSLPPPSDGGGAGASDIATPPIRSQPAVRGQAGAPQTPRAFGASLLRLAANPRLWISMVVVLVFAASTSTACLTVLARSAQPKIARPPMAGLNATVRGASDPRSLPIFRCWETETSNARLTLAPLPKSMRALFSRDVAILLLIIDNKRGSKAVRYDPKLRPVRLLTGESGNWQNLDTREIAERRLSKRSAQLFRGVEVRRGRGNWRLVAFEPDIDLEYVERIYMDLSDVASERGDADVMKESHRSVYEIMEMFKENG